MSTHPPLTSIQTLITIGGVGAFFFALWWVWSFIRNLLVTLGSGLSESQIDTITVEATDEQRAEAKRFIEKYGKSKLVRHVQGLNPH